MPKRHKRHTPDRNPPLDFDPSAARGKLGEAFVRAIAADFRREGAKRIKKLREQRLHDYLKLVFALLPKEFRIKEVELPEMTDEEFATTFAAVQALIAEKERENSQ
jgi:hypothetical protein